MKTPIPTGEWTAAALATWSLGLEAAMVVGMRSARIAVGGAAAQREAALMIAEKIDTVVEIQAALIDGRLGSDPAAITRGIIAMYARKVSANRRRLGG